MRAKNAGTVAASIASASLIGCATIIHGAHQDVGIASSPTGATVSIDNFQHGITPVIAKLTRKDNHIISIKIAGYQPYETTVTRSVSGWVWGNIVFGGLIGLAVDGISGGIYKLTPEQVSGTLAAGTATTLTPDGSIYIVVVLQPSPGWTKIAQLTR